MNAAEIELRWQQIIRDATALGAVTFNHAGVAVLVKPVPSVPAQGGKS